MNAQQFNRKVVIQIGQNGQQGLQMRNLRIVFKIKKTLRSDSFNTANVSIYNLNKDSRNFIDTLDINDEKNKDNLMTIQAGYDTIEKMLFVGNITLVSSEIKRPDVVTTIEAMDGKLAMNQLRIGTLAIPAFTYGKKTSAKRVLKDVIRASGLDTHYNDGIVPDKLYENGFAFIGMGKVLLDNVCNYLGLIWSIQNNTLKLLASGSSDGAAIMSLSSSSGLIGSPEKINVDSQEFTKKERNAMSGKETTALGKKVFKKIGGGWKIRTLLQPTVEPGSVIEVSSEEIPSGSHFRVIEVEHSGDTHGQEWTSLITARLM
jgi:hypothetical protein